MLVADEVKKYADPLYAESDGFMPVAVKLQLLLSKEEDIKKALNDFHKMNVLKPVLDIFQSSILYCIRVIMLLECYKLL